MTVAKTCTCGAQATLRCFDCRVALCASHAVTSTDHLLEGFLTDMGGVLGHWPRLPSTSDGNERCSPHAVDHARSVYARAATNGVAALRALPEDLFSRQCAVAAGGFELRDDDLKRGPDRFVAMAHERFVANHTPPNLEVSDSSGSRFRRTTTRPAWRIATGDTGGHAGSMVVFGDGTWRCDPEDDVIASVPDRAFSEVGRLLGHVPARIPADLLNRLHSH